jgi:flagellar hook-length control protein FliK
MIMQPVNVLPTFVSQDADLKNKDSLEGSKKDADFARYIDKHVDSESKETTKNGAASAKEDATASKGSIIAANDNNTAEKNTRQESDSQLSNTENKTSGDNEAVEISEKKGDEGSTNGSSAENEALSESEQFISLLYNSDKALSNTDAKTNTAVDANTQPKSTLPNDKVDISVSNIIQNPTKDSTDSVNSADKNNLGYTEQHNLKAFSKEELIARSQLKSLNEAQQSSSQALKDYQLSLQSSQKVMANGSISSEQLIHSQLANGLPNQKVSDIAATVVQANKGLLKDQLGTGLYQLPVDPLGKVSTDNSADTSALKSSEKQLESLSPLSAKPLGDVKDQLGDEVKGDTNASSAKNQASGEVKIETSNTGLSKDKAILDKTMQSILMAESTLNEQSGDNKSKQPVITSAQVQAVQQAQQKTPVVNNEFNAADTVEEELSFADSAQLSQDKPKEPQLTSVNKVGENLTARSISEVQNQAVQANQIKQSNDAYIEHQSSEVLNHTVAGDTAQIQKNNVQLQQETISIFKKDFADAVKDKVMLTINQKLQRFDIQLDPPEFGNMQVRVNLQGEQAAVNFIVQNQQAKEALEQNMHKLKDMLAEQGVDVGGANVEQQNQQKDNESESGKAGSNSSRLNNQGDEEHNVEHVLSAKLFDSSATGVDYYA